MQPPLLDHLLEQNFAGLPERDFLQQLVTAHPYFAPAHFFLLQQLNESDSGYNEQAQKTALLFNNPHWLYFKFHQPLGVKAAPVVPMYTDNAVTDTAPDTLKAAADTTVMVEDVIAAPLQENNDNDDDTAVLVKDAVAPIQELPDASVVATEETTAGAFENNDNGDDTAVLVKAESSPVPEAAAGAITENTATAAANNDNDDDNAVLVPIDKTEEMPGMKIDLSASIKSAENEDALTFEPMHLVDYFASQGIKLSDEVQTADKLGKQLRSFTEWLKTMKKVHAGEAGTPGNAEVAIKALAEKSNAENEVVTEAMAEVFVQQGKAGKAAELYQKLSLLNPAKSAYFAAKIENLKG